MPRRMNRTGWGLLALAAALGSVARGAERESAGAQIDRRAAEVMPRVIAWRRDFHQHPELGNREQRTAGIVAEHLRKLGLEVRTGVAHTGVVGLLRGERPGPVVALRADMDALPVSEETELAFKSQARAQWAGRETGVMHACGHDAHTAMLMGVAEVLAGLRQDLHGSVKFVFQPAEEGPPPGEEGGAPLMVAQGVLEAPAVEAIFGLHVFPLEHGTLHTRAGGLMAAADTVRIDVRGRQTHGAMPWAGVDPVVVAAQIVLGLQTVVSRQVDLTHSPVVLSIGSIHGGNRFNIIPEEVQLEGTLRTLDEAVRRDVQQRIRRTAEAQAAAAGASVSVEFSQGAAVTANDAGLLRRVLPTLQRVAGRDKVFSETVPRTTAEDFSAFQERVPGVFFFLGTAPPGADLAQQAPNHSPRFMLDESALVTGVRVLAHLAADYLAGR